MKTANDVAVRGIFKKRLFQAGLTVFALILLLTTIFFCRRPVILISDKAFIALYGEKRTYYRQFSLSLSLFRPVKTINIAEGAGPDLAAQGALSLSRRPFAVFFPYRYREAAKRYLEGRPDAPVVILAGRKALGNSSETGQSGLWIHTDSEADLYRAGAIAGIFARHENQIRNDTGYWGDHTNQEIALFYEGINNEEKTAFVTGLESQEWVGSPLYSPDFEEKNLCCAVILENFRFSGEETPRSLILFTWMDPALAPRKTLVIFDDSPWTQIAPALEIVKEKRQSNLVPSDIIVLRGDKTQKSIYNEIIRSKILKKKVENADN